jgi:hypothetical protein
MPNIHPVLEKQLDQDDDEKRAGQEPGAAVAFASPPETA